MLDFAISALAFIVAISVLVAVHEYGHFWVARKLGFKVLRFSIGFGRPLLRWSGNGWGFPVAFASNTGRWPILGWLAGDPQKDPVEFWISAIPLGGYVKMLDEREGPVPEADRESAFNRRPILSRIAVLLAGPGFNFLFAIVAYWLMFVSGVPGTRPYVDSVAPQSIAAEAGMAAGDIIEQIGGRDLPTWEQAIVGILDSLFDDGLIEMVVSAPNGNRKNITLDARGQESQLTAPEALFVGLGIVVGPRLPPVIELVSDGLPADRAGLQRGDRVVGADGTSIPYWEDLVTYLRARPDTTVALEIERGTTLRTLTVEVASVGEGSDAIGQIGVSPRPYDEALVGRVRVVQRFGIVAGLGASIQKTWETSALTLRMIGRMLTGDVSLKSASGPIMIAAYAGDYAQAGGFAFLGFLSLISISLGIMNLLPVPILDGGRIVEQVIEFAKGSPLSEKSLIVGQQVGIVMLLALMSVVFYNDISRLLGQ
jgi:regulator of sigma E protease